MGENLYQTTGTFVPDKLIADSVIPTTVKGIKVARRQCIGADCILTEDVAAVLSDVVTTAYVSGTFNRAAILLPEGKEITAHETELRKLGIFLRAVQEY